MESMMMLPTNLIGRRCRKLSGTSRLYTIGGVYIDDGLPYAILLDESGGAMSLHQITRLRIIETEPTEPREP